jgi:cell division protein FtsW (lipid II flippase)
MALAVLAAGGLRAALPPELRNGDARWAFIVVVVVLLAILVIGDPGRIDRESRWLRVLTGSLIG